MYYPAIWLDVLMKSKTNESIVDVPAQIRTEHLPNRSLERHRYFNPLIPYPIHYSLPLIHFKLHGLSN
jgi:hypothetical protein